MKRLLFGLLILPLSLFSQKVVINFDSLPDFSLTFGEWLAVDVDSSNTYGFTNFGFPNNTFPMAFIAFNPSLTTPAMDTVPEIQPHSGTKLGACFAATTPPNDDWFISPKIHLKYDGTFSLWVKSYTGEYGLEKYQVAISLTDSNPSSFTVISGSNPLEAPLEWTRKQFSLSEWNNQDVYVAVHCISNDAFVFMIDDLEIDPGSDTPGLLSYLSEDFEEMDDFTMDLSPWTVADLSGGWTYGITGHSFPHSEEPMAYLVFNPGQTTPPMTDQGIQPHTGVRFAACFASVPQHNPNNKWLISPQMRLGTTPKIGLWVQTYNPEYGMEKYNICVSTKTSSPGDFTIVSGNTPQEAPINWGYKTFDLGAYADSTVYVAIQCVSDNTFLFMVDDIEIGSALGTGKKESGSFIIYPNPAKDLITIRTNDLVDIYSIDILDITGKKISSSAEQKITGRTITVSLPGVQPGIYLISLKTNKGNMIRKIIIKD